MGRNSSHERAERLWDEKIARLLSRGVLYTDAKWWSEPYRPASSPLATIAVDIDRGAARHTKPHPNAE